MFTKDVQQQHNNNNRVKIRPVTIELKPLIRASNGQTICGSTHSKPVLQIRGGIEDNSKIIFPINKNIHCDPSLEPSW